MRTVVVWGPAQSGKTAWLAQIYLRAQAAETPWRVFLTEETVELINRESANIEERNQFPGATVVPSAAEQAAHGTFRYEFKNAHTGAVFSIATIDRPGAMYEDLPQNVRDALRDADAIVLLVDHRRELHETEVRKALLRVHLDRKLGTGQDPRPVAVCLSKADRLIRTPQDYRRAIESPDAFVRPVLNAELVRWIDQHYSCFTFLPISSVGLRMSYGMIRRAVFYDERFQPRVSRAAVPINLLRPFTWVFEQLGEAD